MPSVAFRKCIASLGFTLVTVCIAVMATVLPYPALAGKNTDATSRTKIIAAIPADFPPNFSKHPQTGKPMGFAVDVMDELAKICGLEIEYVFGKPWDELQAMLLSGKADVIPALVVNKERSVLFTFTQPIEAIPITWMVRADSMTTGYKPGMKVGVIKGSAAEDRLKTDTITDYKAYNSLQELLFSMLSGQIDIGLAPAPNSRRLALDAGVAEHIRILSPPLFEAKRGIALRPGDDELRQQLDKAIQQFVGSPRYQVIYNNWWSKPPPFWNAKRIVLAGASLLIALGAAMLWWRYRGMKRLSSELLTSHDSLHQQTVILEQEMAERQYAQELLKTQERRIRLLLDSVAEGIVGVDTQGICIMANPAALRLLGYAADSDLLGNNFHNLCHHTHTDGSPYPCNECPTLKAMREVIPTHCDRDLFWRADGSSFAVEYWSHPMLEQDHVVGAVIAFTDISERRRIDTHVRKLSHGLENSASAVMITDINGIIEYVNTKFTAVTGYKSEEALGRKPSILKSEETPREVFPELWSTILAGKEWRGELRNRRKNGEIYWSIASISPLFDERGVITHFIANIEDINERKNAEATIEHLAYFDPLTDLPNRRMLRDRLDLALKRSRRQGVGIALMYIDLDRFKNINDTYGHPAGDQLLKVMATRFQSVLREDDIVCRLGGDEFAILLHDMLRDQGVASVAGKLLRVASAPMALNDFEVVSTASVGVAMFPRDAEDAETLCKYADIALYHAKAKGKNTFSFYEDELNASTHERMALENALRLAVTNNELLLYYQPKVDLLSGRVIGVEALLRWNSPVFGMVSPIRFIPIAEETALITGIGEWVLRTACLQQVAWKAAGTELTMAVNISSVQFKVPNLIRRIAGIIDETGVCPEQVELELTESALVDSPDSAERMLGQIRDLNIDIAIDDFGTGYSSLSYLRHFPVTVLKIDRSFVRDIVHDSGARAIAQTVVDLATNLNMITVAEGVENKEQLDLLQQMGCNQIQGFYFARPAPGNEIPELIGAINASIRAVTQENNQDTT